MILDPSTLLESLGPWALAGISVLIFIESGLLFPFLPGDSLLVTAGLLHSSLGLSVPIIGLCAFVAAALGDQAGYWLGHRFGRRLFTPNARVLKTSRLEEAEAFFDRHGGPALVLGRFVPVVRTYVPLAAGATRYHYRKFLFWNLLGAALWAGGMTVLGSLLGGLPLIADHIDILAVVLVAVSVLPIVITGLRRRSIAASARAADGISGKPSPEQPR